MAERAQVGSVEAIEAFRAHLIVYLSKTRPVVEEVSAELRRTQLWLETDQQQKSDRELRRCSRAAEDAQAALLSARLSSFRDTMGSEQMAVHRARQALAEAEEHRRVLHRWIRDFGLRTESLSRQVGSLDSVLAQDMGQAVAWLTQVVRTLTDYTGTRPGQIPPAPSDALPGSAPESTEPGAVAASTAAPSPPPAAPASPKSA